MSHGHGAYSCDLDSETYIFNCRDCNTRKSVSNVVRKHLTANRQSFARTTIRTHVSSNLALINAAMTPTSNRLLILIAIACISQLGHGRCTDNYTTHSCKSKLIIRSQSIRRYQLALKWAKTNANINSGTIDGIVRRQRHPIICRTSTVTSCK